MRTSRYEPRRVRPRPTFAAPCPAWRSGSKSSRQPLPCPAAAAANTPNPGVGMAPDGAVTSNRTGPRGPGQTMPEVRGLDRLLPDRTGDLPWLTEGPPPPPPWTPPHMQARRRRFVPVRRLRSRWARPVARESPPPCAAWGRHRTPSHRIAPVASARCPPRRRRGGRGGRRPGPRRAGGGRGPGPRRGGGGRRRDEGNRRGRLDHLIARRNGRRSDRVGGQIVEDGSHHRSRRRRAVTGLVDDAHHHVLGGGGESHEPSSGLLALYCVGGPVPPHPRRCGSA